MFFVDCRITLNSPQRITIADALLTKTNAVFLTKTGQIFLGPVSDKPPVAAVSKKDNVDTFALRSSYIPVGRLGTAVSASKAFHLPREVVKVERMPGIWRGVRVASDPKVRFCGDHLQISSFVLNCSYHQHLLF